MTISAEEHAKLREEEDRLLHELARIHEARRAEMRPIIERLIEIRVALPIPVGIVGYGAFHAASVEAAPPAGTPGGDGVGGAGAGAGSALGTPSGAVEA